MGLTQTFVFCLKNVKCISKFAQLYHPNVRFSKLSLTQHANGRVSNLTTQNPNVRFFSQETSIEHLRVSGRRSLPSHIVLNKDDDLLENMDTVIKAPTEVKREFANLQEFGHQHIKETTSIGQLNNPHNRKKNMIPYDNNRIELCRPVGEPPSTYINASPISFPGVEQQFVALSAPPPGSFASFWQMVVDHQISLIVMITDLEESGKAKADKYWPESTSANMELSSGMKLTHCCVKVNYVSHSDNVVYRHTRLLVESPEGDSRVVDHLHSRAFKDGALPRDTTVILDLLFQCQEMVRSKPGPIAVHCSGGAGWTGTFIAVFKLATEVGMEEVEQLDVFETVVTMWRQRMKMVNKPEHYHYIFKCLNHYVTVQLYTV